MVDEVYILCMKGQRRFAKAAPELYGSVEEAEATLMAHPDHQFWEVCRVFLAWEEEDLTHLDEAASSAPSPR